MAYLKISRSGIKRRVEAFDDDKAVCPRCKVPMHNGEPYHKGGEFYHPVNACLNSGNIMHYNGSSRYWSTERGTNRVAQFKRKRDRRAKNRGARLAKKMRGVLS